MTDYNQESLFPESDDADVLGLLHDTEFYGESPTNLSGSPFKESEAIGEAFYDKLDRKEKLENKKQNRQLRKDFAYKAYEIACGCLSFWIVIVCLSAIVSFVTGRLFLSDTALGIITTGVTVTVFAAFLTVI